MHCGEWKGGRRRGDGKQGNAMKKKLSGLKCDECIEKRMQA